MKEVISCPLFRRFLAMLFLIGIALFDPNSRLLAVCQIDEPYQLRVQDDYFGSVMHGYRVVRVQILRAGPTLLAPKDQSLEIVAKLGSRMEQLRTVINRPVVMKKGTSSVTADLYIPDVTDLQTTIFVDLNRNGTQEFRNPNEASIEIQPSFYRSVASYPNGPSFLLLHSQPLARSADNTKEVFSASNVIGVPQQVGEDRSRLDLASAPPLKPLLSVIGQLDGPGFQGGLQAGAGLTMATMNANINFTKIEDIKSDDVIIDLYDYLHSARFADLPEHFGALFTYDVIVVPYSELNRLQQVSEAKRQAIRDWLACGGTIFVLGAPADLGDINNASALLLDLPNSGRPWDWVAIERESELLAFVDTRLKNRRTYDRRLFGQTIRGAFEDQPPRFRSLSDALTEDSTTTGHTDFQLGRIVVTTKPADELDEMSWLSLLTHAYSGNRKMGIAASLGKEPVDFNEIPAFEVPGVGDPPRLTFLFFIFVYALIMGPGLYWILARKKQLALLTVWVPVLSIAATLGLFCFTMIKDGFSLRSVVFSASLIDNRTGHVLTQTDTALFAGWSLRPYEFEKGELPLPSIFGSQQSTTILTQRDDKWDLRGGHMRPRVKHQVNTVRADTTDLRLEIFPNPNDTQGTQWIVENRLGVFVNAVRFTTKDGTFYAFDLRPGAQTVGERADGREGGIDWWSVGDIESALPSENLSGYQRLYRERTYYYSSEDTTQEVLVSQSIAIRTLEAIKSHNSWITNYWNSPGNYVALLDESPLAKKLVPETKPQLQKHVIYGRW